MISNDNINQCKSILLGRQSELITQMQNHFGLETSMKDMTGELSSYDNHPADLGTELYERGKDIALNENKERELNKINHALHAIEEGTYGICTTCGADIPFERLLAVATTEYCVDHADHQTFTRSHPAEEEVFSPNINPDRATAETHPGYDAEDAWQDVSQYGSSDTPSDIYDDQDHYNEVYPNSDERIGSAEDVESFLAADIDGHFIGVTPNHRKYEERLEE